MFRVSLVPLISLFPPGLNFDLININTQCLQDIYIYTILQTATPKKLLRYYIKSFTKSLPEGSGNTIYLSQNKNIAAYPNIYEFNYFSV